MPTPDTMTEWIQALLTAQCCMECAAPLEEHEDTMEFQGILPHVDLLGRLCAACQGLRDPLGPG